MILEILELTCIIGILFMGYFIGRVIEALLIGSWNYPKKPGKKIDLCYLYFWILGMCMASMIWLIGLEILK